MTRLQAVIHLWAWPAALGLLTAIGLGVALVAEGWGNLLSWIVLTVPVIVCLMYSVWPLRPGR